MVPGEELFHDRAVELIETVDAWVVVVEPHAEQLEGVASILDRGRPQRRRARLHVALHESPDLGLRDLGELIGEAPLAGVRMRWGRAEKPELEAHLLQGPQSAVQNSPVIRCHRHRCVQRPGG